MPTLKIQTITLTTITTQLGDECVNRDPSRIIANRADVDVIRIVNGNAIGSGKEITVKLRKSVADTPTTPAKDLFSPVPEKKTKLNPGEHVDWTISTELTGSVGVRFQTAPDTCSGGDQDDIIISN